MVNFKVINQNNTGTAIKFGGDDLDKTHNFLNGQVGFDPVTLRSLFGVEDGKFYIEDPATHYRCYLRTGSITVDQDWLLPVGEGEVVNNIKNIFVNEQVFQKWIKFKKIAVPANPDADHIVLWADSNTGQIMVKDHTGVAQSVFSSISNIANLGSTGESVYDSKVGNTVYLRSLTPVSDFLSITSNDTTNSLDINIIPSNLLLETLGGTLLSSQVPVLGTGNLPSAVVLESDNNTFTGINKFDKELTLKQLAAHPTAPAGYVTLYAKDDNNMYFKNSSGSLFKLLYNTDLDNTVPLPPAGYISGHWDGTNVNGTGLLNNMTSIVDSGLGQTEYHDLTTGEYAMEWSTDDSNTAVGLMNTRGIGSGSTPTANLCYRDANPTLTVRFQVDLTANSANAQAYIGLCSDVNDNNFQQDNPMGTGKHGVILGKRTTDTQWGFCRNDGNNATMYRDSLGYNVDTNVHTIKIVGDNENDRWGMSYDGNAMVWKSDQDPIEERQLAFIAVVSQETAVASIKLRLYDITIWRKLK